MGKGPELSANATSHMEDHKDGNASLEEDMDEELVPCMSAVGVQ
jgi:hypothetical protein